MATFLRLLEVELELMREATVADQAGAHLCSSRDGRDWVFVENERLGGLGLGLGGVHSQ